MPLLHAVLLAPFWSIGTLVRGGSFQGDQRSLMVGQTPDGWDVMVSPLGGLSGVPPYEPWDRDYYGQNLESMWKMRTGSALVATGVGVPSLILDGNGDPFQAPNFDWRPPTVE